MAKGKSPGWVGFSRMVSLLAFLPVASAVPDYARLITALVFDERMPNDRKVLLGAAAGYMVLGRDIVPDTCRSSVASTTSSSSSWPSTCSSTASRRSYSTRSSTTSASTASPSTATSPRSGA